MSTATSKHPGFYLVPVMLMLFTAFVANGCVPVYLPEPPHGVRVITEETLEPLKPGQSTRADVLHLLGDPGVRIKEDRFFVYYWFLQTGMWNWIPLLPFPGGRDLPPEPVWEHRGLVIEFTPDNHVKRLQFYKDDEWSDTLEQWAKEDD